MIRQRIVVKSSIHIYNRRYRMSAGAYGIKLYLHLLDKSDNPSRSIGTHQEPLFNDPNDHTITLHVGEGRQSLKWLAMAAQGRMKMLRKRSGRVRAREPMLGSQADALPEMINMEDDGQTEKIASDPYAKIRDLFKSGDHVWIHFDQSGGSITHWKAAAYSGTDGYKESKGEDDAGKALDMPPLASIALESTVNGTVPRQSYPVSPSEKAAYSPRLSPRRMRTPPNAETEENSSSRATVRPLSVVQPRPYECDSRDYFDSPECLSKLLSLDWKHHVENPQMIKPLTERAFRELRPFYPALVSLYRYYSCVGDHTHIYSMERKTLHKLLRSLELPRQHLVLVGVNMPKTATEEEGVAEDGPGDGAENEDMLDMGLADDEVDLDKDVKGALERYEFMEVMLKIAMNMPSDSLPENLQRLTEHVVFMKGWVGVHKGWWFANPNSFRYRRLYTEETNDMFISHVNKLYTLFLYNASITQRRLGIVGERVNPQMAFEEFYDMMRKGGLLTARSGISLETLRCAFSFSQMIKTDEIEVKHSAQESEIFNRCTFVEFCECLAWLAEMRTQRSAIKSLKFSQDLSMLLGEVVQCVPVSFWATHKVKSYAAIVSRYGRDYNMVKRIGESPEVDRHETSYENETSLLEQENLAFSGRNVYRLPDAVTRAMGKQFFNHCS